MQCIQNRIWHYLPERFAPNAVASIDLPIGRLHADFCIRALFHFRHLYRCFRFRHRYCTLKGIVEVLKPFQEQISMLLPQPGYLSFLDPLGAMMGAVVCLEVRMASWGPVPSPDPTPPETGALKTVCRCGASCSALTFMRAAVPMADKMQTSSEMLVDSLKSKEIVFMR